MFKKLIDTPQDLQVKQVPYLETKELHKFVESFIARRDSFLSTNQKNGSPLYIFDFEALVKRANQFRNVFSKALPKVRVYYALKSNSHPLISEKLVENNFGLDVSSGLELEQALDCNSQDIIFSGPGKQQHELKLAIKNYEQVTVLVDSFGELDRLNKLASESKTTMKCGVRLTTDDNGIWKKFGIPLSNLEEFFRRADRCKFIDLRGIQFHLSWNLNPEAQVQFLTKLGNSLHKLDNTYLAQIKFIDIGGGFWPEQGEWLQFAATPQGILESAFKESPIRALEHYKQSASTIEEFAQQISTTIKNEFPDELDCAICLEPGRWISHESMHMLLTVVDVKLPDVVITDGGTNAIGWDRFESDYFPVINLTHPKLEEHECLIAGSLCTPHDIWGYSYFGEQIKEGDVLLIPNQGAYTYSLRQDFIKSIPNCVDLTDGHKKVLK